MRLTELAKAVDGAQLRFKNGEEDVEIFCLSADSRTRAEGSLFFCLTGGQADGHSYATQAIKKGAVALVVEKELPIRVPQILVEDSRLALGKISSAFYKDPSSDMKVIGITGTNGKTTTSYMLASILENAGKRVGVIGTLGIRYGEQRVACDLTTPDPIILQKTLADMWLRGIEYVVMEVSAHALYYKKIAGVRFCACIFTNFTQDHLDFFSTMNEYKKAKLGLFSPEICPIAILNGDEAVGREIGALRGDFSSDTAVGIKTAYYGLQTPSDAFAVITNENIYGSECMLNVNDNLCRVSLGLTGRHNVYNALAAASCALALGIPADAVAQGLTELKTVKGRLERVGAFHGAEIYVDFAHTPDGLEKSLDALRMHCKGRVFCLFGCGGNRDKAKRPLMGETVAKKADFAILTSDNPRYEDPLDIIGGIERGYRRFSVKYVVVPDRAVAIEYALECLKKEDVLLVAGKGGEEYQEVMGIKYPFNDNDIIEKLLKRKERESL